MSLGKAGTMISAAEARRIALAAQGLAASPKAKATRQTVVAAIHQLGLLQIDSVNVITRAHYMPLFSRLGAYDQSWLEEMAWHKNPELFEYWGHEASLLPIKLQPLLRWRMADVRNGATGWVKTAAFMRDQKKLLRRVLDEICDRGSLAASDLDLGKKGSGGWWGWSDAKRALECLFAAGEITVTTRRSNFERVYGVPEKSMPAKILALKTPSRDMAQQQLICLALRALGIATETDLRDYFRMQAADTKRAIASLIEQGSILPVAVDGWTAPAYLDPEARCPRSAKHQALLSPFDNAIWHRDRTERLFGTRVRLEIYTPAAKRLHGYYVLPFLEGDAITARVDLKADRQTSTLIVKASHAEPAVTADTSALLAAELRKMSAWLGLGEIKVESRGSLARAVSTTLKREG